MAAIGIVTIFFNAMISIGAAVRGPDPVKPNTETTHTAVGKPFEQES